MDNRDIITRRSWLPLALATQRNKLTELLLRLKGIGLRVGTSLKLHLKFLRMMEQVAADKDKELEIINEIEAIEKRHELMRRQKLLRRADPDFNPEPKPQAVPIPAPENPAERARTSGILGLLAWLAAMHINHKKQDLTVD